MLYHTSYYWDVAFGNDAAAHGLGMACFLHSFFCGHGISIPLSPPQLYFAMGYTVLLKIWGCNILCRVP